MDKLEIKYVSPDTITPCDRNPRKNEESVDLVDKSIQHYGWTNPILVRKENNVIIAGHTRLKAAIEQGLAEVPVIYLDMNEPDALAYMIADNKMSEIAEWDQEKLDDLFNDLNSMDFDLDLTGFDTDDIGGLGGDGEGGLTDEDAVPEDVEATCKLGQLWQLGRHRLLCGDSTSKDQVERLMDGEKADMVFTDPPYGMKKENEGILNDNLNYSDLLEFNKKWIPLTFEALKDVGSWYCWGIDEPLMDIYSEILKPAFCEQKATFRNLITWDKGNGQGQNAEEFRMYPIADEKCLFVMMGVQGFNNNADNYFQAWDPIVEYLKKEKDKAGFTIKDCKRLAGHSETSGCHWFDKSQWMMPTEETYDAWKTEANGKAFKKEYDEIKKEYDEIKKEYYATRAYFDNVHDNMNNVWHFKRTSNEEREMTGGHASPKPVELCERAIKSSSRLSESCLDVFGGSGSTMIACEKTERNCFMMELDPKYCDVIIARWEDYTGEEAVLLD